MDFSLESNKCNTNNAKIGKIRLRASGFEQKTPCFVNGTRAGLIPHLTDSVLRSTCHSNMPKICGVPLDSVFEQSQIQRLKAFNKPFEEFCGMKGYPMMFLNTDCCKGRQNAHTYNEERSISIWTQSGRTKVSPQILMEMAESFQVTFVESLADVIPSSETAKRCKKSVDRTIKFLDECIKYKEGKQELLNNCHLFGVITGGDNEQERIRSAMETAKRKIQGIILAGLSEMKENKLYLVESSVEALGDSLRVPLMLQGAFNPGDVVSAVKMGIDLFDTSYVLDVTGRGCALVFKFNSKRHKGFDTDGNVKSKLGAEDTKALDYEVDLQDQKFKDDFNPIVKHCLCYTCHNHSKAYINHLLTTNEMLAPVLLTIHNLHHFTSFFDEIRNAIALNQLDELQTLLSAAKY